MTADDLKRFVRDIPDFPKPGILFRDVTPLLLDPHDDMPTPEEVSGHRHLRLGSLQSGRERLDRALTVLKPHLGGVFGNGADGADSVLRMTNRHADVQRFNLHGRILSRAGAKLKANVEHGTKLGVSLRSLEPV